MCDSAAGQQLRLVTQWGVRYPPGATPSRLVFPFSAQWTAFDTCLVVDRCRPRNRLLEVDQAGAVVWTFEAPPRMNFAHRLDSGMVLYTQQTGLYGVEPGGTPRLLSRLHTGTAPNCGSVCGDRLLLGGDDGLDLFTLGGRHLAHLPPGEFSFREPVGVQLLPSGNLLVVDGETACVIELDPRGRQMRVFGRWRQPGLRDGRLCVPLSAARLADQRTIVADWRGHRLISYDPDGQARGVLPATGRARLFAPAGVSVTPAGDLLVAETGHRRVSRRTVQGDLRWEYGPPVLPERTLSFPRSATPVGPDQVLVCDSYQERIVVLDARSGDERWAFGRDCAHGENSGMSIPRSATRSRAGVTCVADGLNGRALLLDAGGRICREIIKVRMGDRSVPLCDPHHVVMVDSGEVMLVDSDLNQVLLLDQSDRVVMSWGGAGGATALSDPHQARLLPDGGLLVADSGHHRIVEFDRHGQLRWQLTHTVDAPGADPVPVRYPRFADRLDRDRLLVVDTDGCRIVLIDRDGAVHWQLGPVLTTVDSPGACPELRVPKWAAFDHSGRLMVADYYNSRIAVFAR